MITKWDNRNSREANIFVNFITSGFSYDSQRLEKAGS